jgi:iron(III) transport system substrate-binding protein
MRKSLILFLIFICSAVCLSATGSQEKGAEEKKVVAYTAHEDAVVNALVPRFEAETGIDLEFVKLGSWDVINRVVAEASNPQCDVIWSISGDPLEANSGALEKYVPKDWDKINPVFKAGTNWLPYTGDVNVFIVNTKLVPENLTPKKWTDLADPKLKKLVSSARADKSGSAYQQLIGVLSIYKDRGWDVFKSLMLNFSISGSSGSVPKFVNDGETAVGITLEDNAYRYVKGGGPVKIVYPEDGTIVVGDGVALVKGAPHPEAGKVFIDWCLSKSTQDFLVDTLSRRSVRLDGKAPAGLPDLTAIKSVPYDFAWAASNKDSIMKRYTDLLMELGL